MGEISEEKVRNAVAQVKHPAIDRTLMELGILKDITVEGDKVIITLAFPFPGIPIRELLVESVREPVEEMGAKVEVKTTVMTAEELQAFLAMEQEAWGL
ncbi:MAG: iron-sulfur cluster assembly protein [Methanophagales archaeon]|nr:iron-sulfur cluster assembly protein [Methanophagales archaeon]MCW7070258.1 iron-sulfur cluster assembly protein [Methanophagales archaeon]